MRATKEANTDIEQYRALVKCSRDAAVALKILRKKLEEQGYVIEYNAEAKQYQLRATRTEESI